MDNKRIILWVTFGILLWANVMQWQHDYPPPVLPLAPSDTVIPTSQNSLPNLPSGASSSSSLTTSSPPVSSAAVVTPPAADSKIHVVTDVLDLDINTRGGDIERADLLKYSLSKEQPTTPVRLLDDEASSLFVIHSGLLSADQTQAPDHLALYTASVTSYQLEPSQNELTVDLQWSNGKGVEITKSYIFKRSNYAIEVRYAIHNTNVAPWQAASYVELYRHDLPVERSMFKADTMSYRGPAVYDGKSYHKLDLKSEVARNYKVTSTDGWMAALQHHFVVAAVPAPDKPYEYTLLRDNNNDFTLTNRGPLVTVAPNASETITEKLFVGPKLQNQLTVTGTKLELTADYGRLTLIAQPLFDLLQFVHKWIGNWGVDIIIVTLLIKLAFYWLTASSGRSMAKMRTVAPKLKAIQERYKDDREQLGRATMELYKKEKINPIAGCLPMLIQMPFFMGFYWVLLESAEMHQAPFAGWITDLSARDPYFVLPIIMGVANFVQFKMNPPPPDPTQAKVMAFMPIMMTVMMAWFPSGLVLYWITNTITSALQQWRINKLVAADNQRRTA